MIDRIDHHYTTGISTVETASKNSKLLNDEFKKYFQNNNAKYATYALKGEFDKIAGLKKLLDTHHIPYEHPKAKVNIKGWDYENQKNRTISFESDALILNAQGKKGKLIQALFEPKTQLSDSITYDITSWSLPYAYGLKAVASQQKISNTAPLKEKVFVPLPETNAYAYATAWRSIEDGKFLAALLNEKIRVRYNLKPLVNGGKRWAEGSLFILKGENKTIDEFDKKIKEIALKNSQNLTALASGFSDSGIDLGSNLMEFIPQKRVGLLKSDNSSPQGYGEIWHFFEQQLKYPITQISVNRLNSINLDKFDVLILPPGYYNLFSDDDSVILKWIKRGAPCRFGISS